MKTMVIVGSAPLEYDYSTVIDSCECVVRFNNCKNYGGNSGTKTDIMVLNNCGNEHKQRTLLHMLKPRSREAVELELPYLHQAKQVLFARPPTRELVKFISECVPVSSPFKPTELHYLQYSKNLAQKISAAQRIPQEKLRPLPTLEFYSKLWYKLLTFGETEAVMPSTGMLGIELILNTPLSQNFKIYIIGFTWQMWDGHPHQLEKMLIAQYVQDGQLHDLRQNRMLIGV